MPLNFDIPNVFCSFPEVLSFFLKFHIYLPDKTYTLYIDAF